MFLATEIPESDTAPLWLYVANGVELLINICGIFVGIIVVRVISRHKLYHSNLRLLMSTMGFGWFLSIGSRAASLVQQLVQPEATLGTFIVITKYPFIILEISRVIGGNMVVMGALLAVFERIVASFLLDRYEGQKHTKVVILAYIAGMTCVGIINYFTFQLEYSQIIIIISIVFAIGAVGAFVAVDKWNKARLERSIKLGFNYTLNQRFQLSENIRVAAIVYKTSLFGLVGSTLFGTLVLAYTLMKTATQVYILRAVYNTYLTLYFIALIVVLVTGPVVWRKEFLRQLRNVRRRLTCSNRLHSTAPNSNAPRARIQNTDGVKLEFSNQEEGQVYFEQLAAMWNK